MKIDLSEIASTPGSRATHQFSEVMPESHDLHWLEPARGSLTAANTGHLLLLDGQIVAKVEMICSRCLQPFPLPVAADFHEELEIRASQAVEQERFAPILVDETTLDLTELVRQTILAREPLQPLCRPDCKGLCSRCGQDLNLAPCSCPKEEFSSPMEALLRWKKG